MLNLGNCAIQEIYKKITEILGITKTNYPREIDFLNANMTLLANSLYALAAFIYIPFFWYFDSPISLHSTILGSSLLFSLLIFYKRAKNLPVIVYTYLFFAAMTLVGVVIGSGGVISPAFDWFCLVIMAGFLSFSFKGGMFATVLILVFTFCMGIWEIYVSELPYQMTFAIDSKGYKFYRYYSLFIFFLLSAVVIYYFEYSQKKSSKEARIARDNERQRAQEIDSMLESMQQGIISINEDFIVDSKFSQYTKIIFESTKIAGQSILDLLIKRSQLGADSQDQVASSLNSIVGSDELSFEMNSHLLPKELVIEVNDNKKYLEVDWQPIIDKNDCIVKLMVVIRDITEVRKLKIQALEKQKTIMILDQLLSVDKMKLNKFFLETDSNIKAIEDQLKDDSKKVDFDQVFRLAHTIKGTVRIFGFSYAVDLLHEFEGKLKSLKTSLSDQFKKDNIMENLEQITQDIQAYKTVYDKKLASYGSSENAEGVLEKIANLLDSNDAQINPNALIQKISNEVIAVHYETLADKCSELIASMQPLATELGKDAPKIKITDQGVYFRKNESDFLLDAMMHCLRNALDHGIESPQKRLQLKKPSAGQVFVEVYPDDLGAKIIIYDDGAGLDLEKIKIKAEKNGLINDQSTLQEIADAVFASGVSTADKVTQISGRGVGMDAVAHLLAERGCSIKIALDPHTKALQKTPFKFVLSIDRKFIRYLV